jgi:hypothetical protein
LQQRSCSHIDIDGAFDLFDGMNLILQLAVEFMANALGFVDSQLQIISKHLDEDFKVSGDSPFIDDVEHLHGIGFVIAQRYLTSACGLLGVPREEKPKALGVGPEVGATTVAAAVNAVANHWKHSDEWDFNNLHKDAKRTIQTIESLGVEVTQFGGYVASKVLPKLGPKGFIGLRPILATWSSEVEKTFKK